MSHVTADQVQQLVREAVLMDVGTAGSIIFLDSNKKLAQAPSSVLFWDNTNFRLGVGISTPTGKIHINQSSTTAAIPSIHLEQNDVSEEAIRVTAQAGSGILTQTLVAGATVTTETIAGYMRINVQDEGNQITDSNYYVPFYTIS